MSEGLLSPFLGQLSALGFQLNPQLMGKELVVEITQADIEKIIFKDANPQTKNVMKVEIHEGKIVIKVKLF